MTATDWVARATEWSNAHPPPVRAPAGSRVPRTPAEHEAWSTWTRALHASGLAVMHWPTEWGGRDADAEATRAVSRVLSQAGAPLPLSDIGISLVGPSIMQFGSSAQRSRHLPPIAEGTVIWTQLFSEPEAGSDLASLRTRATREDDGSWVVSGGKVWNTYAQIADWGYLLARTGAVDERHRTLTMFLVPMDAPGITIRPIRKITGSADFSEVLLQDVRLGPDAVLGETGGGWSVAMSTLDEERRVVGRFVVGLEAEVSRLTSVITAIGPGASDAFRIRLATIAAETNALLGLVEATPARPGIDSLSKVAYSELNVQLHQLAVEVAAEHPADVPSRWAERWSDNYLNSPSYTIAGGANEVLRNVVAKRVLGLGGQRA